MRCAVLSIAALSLLTPPCVRAQVRSFPYDAVVETDSVPIHSGPGFYETGRLKRGEHVTVHRHDPGGWWMISPPAGEFSLIEASAIKRLADGTAEIIADETSVRIGSRTVTDFSVEQVPLIRGDRVEVLDGISTPPGWIAITPPRGEYRWVLGRFLVPVDPAVRTEQDHDPFAVPSTAKRPERFEDDEPALLEAIDTPDQGPSLTSGSPDRVSESTEFTYASNMADALRMLDRELEGLMLTEPSEWPLDELSAEYERLKNASPAMSRQINVRLAQIGKMRLVKDHYTDYVTLTSATDRRDAELVAKRLAAKPVGVIQAAETSPAGTPTVPAGPQIALAPPEPGGEVGGPVVHAPPPAPPAEPRPLTAAPRETHRPMVQGGPPFAASGVTNTPAGNVRPQSRPVPPSPPNGAQRFDAIGIVQRIAVPHPQAPQHVLVGRDGRVVAYLQQQPGISLDQFIGQPMGVDGQPHRGPDLATPTIVVQRLTPVRF